MRSLLLTVSPPQFRLMDSKIAIDQDINSKEINSKIQLIRSKMNELS